MNLLIALKQTFKKIIDNTSPRLVPMDKDAIIPDGVTECKKYLITPVYLLPDDTFKCTVKDSKHGKQVVQEEITTHRQINTIITFTFDNIFGLKSGFGAVFGEDK